MNYYFRTGRIFKLRYDTGEISYHLDANNGYSEWRFSSPIVDASMTNDGLCLILTKSGNEYKFRYHSQPIFKLYEDYMKINKCVDYTIYQEYNDFLCEFFQRDDTNVY